MATKSLTFDVYGRDRSASKTIRGVGNETERVGNRLQGFKVAAGVAFAVVGAAAVQFGTDSLKAYAEAEEAQLGLEDALARFPRLADTNIGKLQELNGALMAKTRFDDDAIAAGQTVLAQYELTGAQLEELTPLLLDYAQKVGKDVPTAAEDLGKALLGQGRALKDVGIDFEDTGTVAGNLDQIIGGLRGQVSGFAEESAGTAAGKLDRLKNKFGEIQEAVGEELLDPLTDVMDTLLESGALEDTATAVGDIAEGFADLEQKTGWFSGFAEDMAGFGEFVDDVERWGEAISNIADPKERYNWAEDQIERGGLFGWWLDEATKFGERWDHLWGGEVPSAVKGGMDGARGGAGGGLSAISGDMSGFENATKGRWSGLWSDVDGRTRSGMGTINSSTSGGIGTIGGTLAAMNPTARGAFVSAWLAAQAATGSGWAGVDGSTRGGMGRVGGTLSGFRGVVQGPFSGAASWLIAAGGNIVQGLVGGIAGMVGSAARAAANLAANVVAGAKSALGIQSPSKVFREIGEFVGQGFELGVKDMQPRVAASVEAMIAPPRTDRTTAASSAPAGKVEYHYHATPIRDNDPETHAAITGREFARLTAGGR